MIKKDKKIAILLRDERELYHTQDLSVLWGISKENTLFIITYLINFSVNYVF